jgi:cell division protein FtsQ
MGRRQYEGTARLPGLDEAQQRSENFQREIANRSVDSPPRLRSRAAPTSTRPLPTRQIVIGAVVTVLILVAAFLIFNRVERFLINDPRFALNGPEGASETPTLEVAGAAHASHRAIQAVFAGDSGRSVYMLPLADRRVALRAVDWVKDVSIARIWPNRIVVRILERKPVAFVPVAANRFGLIDADGVILPPAADRFTFPVLAGVRVTDKIEERRDRVQRMLRLTGELGDQAAQVSEIDVSDRDNLKVTQPWEGRIVTLHLGDHNFALRYRNFLNNFSAIKQRLPGAVNLDLRLEDRITVVE